MVIHDHVTDVKGSGRWDIGTSRYIPVNGGSRSRLPIREDKAYPRYLGFIGMDDHLTTEISTMAGLFTYLGGMPQEGQGSVFVKLVHEQIVARLGTAEEQK